MKHNFLLLAVLILLTFSANAQTNFEPAFVIMNDGSKVEGFIKNSDWQNNPEAIQFKSSEQESIQRLTLQNVEAFSIGSSVHYKRYIVDVDQSSEIAGNYSNQRNPEFRKDTIWLKFLVQGDISLLHYKSGTLDRFFYQEGQNLPEQLVYKKYLTSNGDVSQNLTYLEQLARLPNCGSVSSGEDLINVDYNYRELSSHFVNALECNELSFVDHTEKESKGGFRITPKLGVNTQSLEMDQTPQGISSSTFESKVAAHIGAELEVILPFNNKKWALLVEPNYTGYEDEQVVGQRTALIDYSSVEVPTMIRHYFFLNEESKLFFNTGFVFEFAGDSVVDFSAGDDFEIEPGASLALGVGYNYNSQFSLEGRWYSSKDLLGKVDIWGTDMQVLSAILGYTIFSN